MKLIAPVLDVEKMCPMMLYTEITLSECAWKMGVFIANEPMFRPRIPEDSNAASTDLANPPFMNLCTKTLGVYEDPMHFTNLWVQCGITHEALDASLLVGKN
jgi:hypothetical protein